ncbi:MAG TPA: thiamine phosphate synthase [Syntrophobacteraceae bacterium]|nr:thiamine phosphate synthase [Syntrophobacteraceae bacterium]HBD06651.1 thiamine phosphate synthase [Syntrophobacteraceae bacterium]
MESSTQPSDAHVRTCQVDWSVYLVTDPVLVGPRSLIEVVAAAIRGGVTMVQYRDKNASTRVMAETASGLVSLCHRMGAMFVVNDRIDVALAVDADGVHLGQDDMPVATARRLLGPNKLLGVSVHNRDEIRQAEHDGADHVSLSPVFATATKADHQPPLDLEGVRTLSRTSHLPVIAIGGIHAGNAADVIRAGARGICVVSAIISAPDPERAALDLCRTVAEARR